MNASPRYRETLESLRESFPRPTSDRQRDAYFVFSILRALDRVDSMKSTVPILGMLSELDYAGATDLHLPEHVRSVEEVSDLLAQQLEGVSIVGHPLSHTNVNGIPSIASIIGALLPIIYNPNMVTDASGRGLVVAEQAVTSMVSELVGYDPRHSGGVFTFGGTGTNLYGIRIGIEKAFPGAMQDGIPPGGVILASDQSHYCRMSIAGWLGVGAKNVVSIPTGSDNAIDLEGLDRAARQAIESGRRVLCVIATMGTTDSLGIDDLQAMRALRDRWVSDYKLDYRPHLHADAVIGWVWSVFSDYDFDGNDLGFRPRTVRALASVTRRMSHLGLADSFGIDFHKTGFAPYISSLFVAKTSEDLLRLSRDRADMPYLFNMGDRHPGTYTLETSRGGSGVLSAFASLNLLGKEGLRCLIGHMVDASQHLRECLEGHATTSVVNDENAGPVTLFRVYPKGTDTWTRKNREQTDPGLADEVVATNEYNRQVFQQLQRHSLASGGPLLSLTDCYRKSVTGVPIVAMKSYIMSPFIEPMHVEEMMRCVIAAQEAVDARE